MRHFRLIEEERARHQIRRVIGRRLGQDCASVVNEPLPEKLRELLDELEKLDRRRVIRPR